MQSDPMVMPQEALIFKFHFYKDAQRTQLIRFLHQAELQSESRAVKWASHNTAENLQLE